MRQARGMASFCSMADQFVFATGGIGWTVGILTSVERYDIANDAWEEMPHLNESRADHSSCALATAVYVFGGFKGLHTWLTSVEKLETRDLKAGWQLI